MYCIAVQTYETQRTAKPLKALSKSVRVKDPRNYSGESSKELRLYAKQLLCVFELRLTSQHIDIK